MQFVGSTTDKFRGRWKITRKTIGKPKEERNICSQLFLSIVLETIITVIDKTDGSDPTRKEEYWRRVLKIVTPYGLNITD